MDDYLQLLKTIDFDDVHDHHLVVLNVGNGIRKYQIILKFFPRLIL